MFEPIRPTPTNPKSFSAINSFLSLRCAESKLSQQAMANQSAGISFCNRTGQGKLEILPSCTLAGPFLEKNKDPRRLVPFPKAEIASWRRSLKPPLSANCAEELGFRPSGNFNPPHCDKTEGRQGRSCLGHRGRIGTPAALKSNTFYPSNGRRARARSRSFPKLTGRRFFESSTSERED